MSAKLRNRFIAGSIKLHAGRNRLAEAYPDANQYEQRVTSGFAG
jgi:hypothetical protein